MNVSTTWIEDDEKYGLVGLSVKVEGQVPLGKVAPNLWVLANTTFNIPSHWQQWLGSIRTRQLERCELFLLSKKSSAQPDILDGENEKLKQHAWLFYVGLLLASTFAPAHPPIVLTGSRRAGEINIRQQQDLDSPVPCLFQPYPPVSAEEIHLAAVIGQNLDAFSVTPLSGGHWRLFRTLRVYIDARTAIDIPDRLHQYSRCIDGLILPDAGRTRQQFKSRTELFIGPRHHDLMGEIYDVRCAVEHLHENRYLDGFDRETRIDLVKKEAIIHHIARMALARVITNNALWDHFANTAALAQFWALPAAERRRIWDDPVDPMDAIANFDPKYIHDGVLGAP